METIYKKVPVSDRLPNEPGNYLTNRGWRKWNPAEGYIWNGSIFPVDYWLEEQPSLPPQESRVTAEEVLNKYENRPSGWQLDDIIQAMEEYAQSKHRLPDVGKTIEGEHKCRCVATMNEGEAKTFTCCDKCWDDYIAWESHIPDTGKMVEEFPESIETAYLDENIDMYNNKKPEIPFDVKTFVFQLMESLGIDPSFKFRYFHHKTDSVDVEEMELKKFAEHLLTEFIADLDKDSVKKEVGMPSDEEIEKFFSWGYGGDKGSAIYGAKWMRSEIQKQINPKP